MVGPFKCEYVVSEMSLAAIGSSEGSGYPYCISLWSVGGLEHDLLTSTQDPKVVSIGPKICYG